MSVKLQSLGTALPEHRAEQSILASLAGGCSIGSDHPRLLAALYRRSGVKHRSIVLLEHDGDPEHALAFYPPALHADDCGPTTAQRMQRYVLEAAPLALRAARQAIDRSAIDPASIAHLVTVSCTGFAAPGIDVALLKALDLSPTISRTHIGFMGCHGAFNALRVASAFAEQSDTPVLICAVELCSLHFAYGFQPQQIVANSLFADGAAAAIVTRTATADEEWTLAANGSCLMPECDTAMTWIIGDHGFEMTLSPEVPALIAAHLRPWLEQWLALHGLSVRDVQSWAVHPGGPRILQAVAEPLSLPAQALTDSYAVLSTCGNMSSPTILFILDRLRQRHAPRPCVALGFGPGLAVEAMLMR